MEVLELRIIIYLLLMSLSVVGHAKPLEPREVPTDIFVDRSGLPELVIQSTFTGLLIGPIITHSLFNDEIRQNSGLLLGPALGITLPFLLNRGKPVHVAQASTYNFFQRSGFINGGLLAAIASYSPTNRGTQLLVSGTTLASTVLGTYLEPKLKLTPGQSSSLTSSYFIGGVTGLMLHSILTADKDFEGSIRLRSGAITTLIAANSLSLTTYLMRESFDIDRSRVIMMDIGAVGGGLAGLGAGFFIFGQDTFENDNTFKVLALSSLIGIYGGIYLAYSLTQNYDVYKKNVNSPEAGVVTFNSPSPMVVTSVDNEQGAQSFGFGLNILNGTW